MKTSINYQAIDELKGEVFDDLIKLYLQSSVVNLERMELFMGLKDATSLKKEAHFWALSSGVIGAEKLANILMEIEFSHDPVDRAHHLLLDCQEEFLQVEKNLRLMMKF